MSSTLFPTLRAVCAVSALATAGLWGRSFYASDMYNWKAGVCAGNGFDRVESRTVHTSPGVLVFQERTGVM